MLAEFVTAQKSFCKKTIREKIKKSQPNYYENGIKKPGILGSAGLNVPEVRAKIEGLNPVAGLIKPVQLIGVYYRVYPPDGFPFKFEQHHSKRSTVQVADQGGLPVNLSYLNLPTGWE